MAADPVEMVLAGLRRELCDDLRRDVAETILAPILAPENVSRGAAERLRGESIQTLAEHCGDLPYMTVHEVISWANVDPRQWVACVDAHEQWRLELRAVGRVDDVERLYADFQAACAVAAATWGGAR